MPLCCPKCGKVMKGQLDKPNYKIHKKCHDCVIEFEHKLNINKTHDAYIKELKNKFIEKYKKRYGMNKDNIESIIENF